MKKNIQIQVIQSFAISLAISICIPILLFALKSWDKGKAILSSCTVYDETGEMSADEAWRIASEERGIRNSSHHLDLGFFKGNCFVIFDSSDFYGESVLDLGPETIDFASLFVRDETGTWRECDRSGRMVRSAEKKIRSWQCSLKNTGADSAKYTGGYILKIKNNDFTSLVVRCYSITDYLSRLQAFSSIHTVLLFLMFLTVVVLFVAGLYLRNLQMIFLSLMNFSLLMYAISMTGLGSAYIWNGICTMRFTSRLGYSFGALGFCFLEIFYLSIFHFKNLFSSLTIVFLFAFSLIFSVLILLLPDARLLMTVTICVLICGLIFITFVNMNELSKNSEPILFLVSSWLPLFCYVIFRQTIHLLRMKIPMENLEKIFDNDYYFGYQICFLSNIVTYGIYILKKSIDSRKTFVQYKESAYFLKSTAHELLSPITLIENAAQELDSGTNKKQISVIQKNCERIKNMTVLAATLEIHEQNFETLHLENCVLSLNSELQKCLEGFELYAVTRNIKIETLISTPESLMVMAQPLYLETVFLNLIDNAMKHSGNDTKISISLDYDKDKRLMTFSVKNPKGKLTHENLEEIFEFGKRISENDVQGFGLGLHLTRRICRLYKGDCTAELEGNQVVFYALMHLEIPASNEEHNNMHTETSDEKRMEPGLPHPREIMSPPENIRALLSHVKILLVEDNIIMQESMREFLGKFCTVFSASNGEEALSILSEDVPAIIISDMLMPVMGGEALYAECKKTRSLSNIPFIFLTGIYDKKIQERMISLGAADYLCKPFCNEDLILKIYSVLNREVESRKRLKSALSDFLENQTESYADKHQDKHQDEHQDEHQDVAQEKGISKSEDDKVKTFFVDHELSKREIEIALLMAKNKTNQEIANELFISVSTVATHVQHIYGKCNVRSRMEFVSTILHL